jgi:hypothetical protein
MGAVVLGIPGTVALAACGDKQVVTREVPVERVVVKEVEVDRVVTQRVEKVVNQEVEKILRHEVAVEKVVENVVTKEVETTVEDDAMPQRPSAVLRLANDHTSGARGATMIWALETFHQQSPTSPSNSSRRITCTRRRSPLLLRQGTSPNWRCWTAGS